jgi:hypothetical protein
MFVFGFRPRFYVPVTNALFSSIKNGEVNKQNNDVSKHIHSITEHPTIKYDYRDSQTAVKQINTWTPKGITEIREYFGHDALEANVPFTL